MDQAFTAAVGPTLHAQLVEQRSGKAPDRPLPPAELVIQIEHRRDQTRPQLKRRAGHAGAHRGGMRRARKQQLPLRTAEQWRRAGERDVKPAHPLVTRQQIGQDDRPAGAADRRPFDRLPQQFGRRACRHDNRAAPRVERPA